MEKTPATQAFTPSRNFGVMIWDNFDPCWDTTWFAGLFRADSPDSPANTGLWRSDNNDWSFSTRLAWLPFYDEPSKGRYLVHLGGSYSFRHIGGLTSGAAYNQNVAYSTLNGLAEFSNGASIWGWTVMGTRFYAHSTPYLRRADQQEACSTANIPFAPLRIARSVSTRAALPGAKLAAMGNLFAPSLLGQI